MVEMKVNPGELAAGGRGLEEAANGIPEPLAPFTSTGTDALSTILASLTQAKEAPLIEGLPATKAAAIQTAQNIQTAAGMYERSDQQIATDVQNATAKLDAPGGSAGAGNVGSAGGGSQMQQLMSVPMQMAQQAGQMAGQVAQSVSQLPQTMMQGVQSGIQQIGQMTASAGAPTDADTKLAKHEGAAPGDENTERAPGASDSREPGAVPDAKSPKHARGVDPEIAL